MNTDLLAEVMLGKDAEEFLATELGRYIIGCADQEIKEAQDRLKSVAPWRKRRITELQNQIWRAESFESWMAEIIIKGQQAMQQLDEE